MGQSGVIWRTSTLELWPAIIIVIFRQEWTWPGITITLYGRALMTKVAIGLLASKYGLKSLAMSQRVGDKGFMMAGLALCIWGHFEFTEVHYDTVFSVLTLRCTAA